MRPEKKCAVEEFQKDLEENSCAILTRYTGISSEQLNSVRSEICGKSGKYQVVKNRLFSLAALNIGIEGIDELTDGQVGVVYSNEDQSMDILKYLVKFKKENGVLDVLGGILEGNLYHGKDLQVLSKLPGKDMMRSRVLGAFQSPLSGFAGVLRARLLSLLYVINAIIEKQSEDGPEAAAS